MFLKKIQSDKLTYLQAGILLAAFIGLYFPFILAMEQDWSTNDNFSHGYFIPVIAAYMVYSRRTLLKGETVAPSNWGLLIIALGLVQLIIAKIGTEFFLQRTSMIVVLFGSVLFLLGKSFTRKVSFPLIYLVFMIPIPAIIWNNVAFPMQLFASGITERVVQAIGIPVFREGNVLHLSETTLEVVDACSGLRSLTSMLALGAALAYFSRLPGIRKWAIFLSALPIAIFVNIIRLTITAALASRFGGEIAQGFLHDFSGWLIFIVGLASLWGVAVLLSKGKYQDAPH